MGDIAAAPRRELVLVLLLPTPLLCSGNGGCGTAVMMPPPQVSQHEHRRCSDRCTRQRCELSLWFSFSILHFHSILLYNAPA